MKNIVFCFIVTVKFLCVECTDCPTHCFCYEWNYMMRTDCVNRNMYNTFATFSPKTQVLDLSHNVIAILHGNEFLDANLRQLKDLRISYNRLHKIDKLSFNGLTHLESVDVSHNDIEFITPTTFKYNPMLRVLNISNNPLSLNTNEPLLSDAPALQILNMAHCSLNIINPRLFLNLEFLRVLNLSENGVKEIHTETLEPMRKLKHIDLSKNDLTCNDYSATLQKWLMERRIHFQPFCQTSNEMLASVILTRDEFLDLDTDNSNERNVSRTAPEKTHVLEEIKRLIQSIPPFYAMLCGIQMGILIGSICTYFCIRKATKSRPGDEDHEIGSSSRFIRNDPDNMTFALISLNTPPGTPPSPYQSRLTFSSNFSLTRT